MPTGPPGSGDDPGSSLREQTLDFLSFITAGTPWWTLLVICPLLFIAGFIDAIGGGGGLISIPAYMFCGLPAHQVIGTNKLSSSMGTLIATAKYVRAGYVDWKLTLPCVAMAFAGSAAGAQLSLVASERFLMYFMLIAIPVVAFYVLRSKNIGAAREPWSRRRTVAICMGVALGVGVYDGFYGPGTGTFLMLLLDGLARLDIYKAAGTTKVVNLTTNIAALATFLANGTVLVGLGLVGGLFNIAGNYLGARTFTHKGSKIVRPVILVVLGVFAVRIVLQLTGVWA